MFCVAAKEKSKPNRQEHNAFYQLLLIKDVFCDTTTVFSFINFCQFVLHGFTAVDKHSHKN